MSLRGSLRHHRFIGTADSLSAPTELFGHLGLAEPRSEKGVRWAGVCPPCVGDSRRSEVQWIEIHVLALNADRTRVYMQAY